MAEQGSSFSPRQPLVQPQTSQIPNVVQKVGQAIPQPVNQAVREGIERVKKAEMVEKVKAVTPEVKQEVKTYVKGFRLRMRHLIFLGYFLAIFLWRLLHSPLFPFEFKFLILEGKNLFLWILGGILGWNLPNLDYFVYVYFTNPEGELSLKAKYLIGQRKISQAIFLLKSRELHLAFRGVLFRLVWIGLALFTLTSTASFLGKGLLMGLGLNLLLQEWREEKVNPQVLNSRLFWQIKRKVSLQEQKFYLWGMTGVFIILSLLI